MSVRPLHVVLGAGPAGTALTAELARRQVRVRQVSRGEIPEHDGSVERLRRDVSGPRDAIAATEGAAVIYNALNVPYHLQVDTLPNLTQSVLAAAAHHQARLVVLGTLYPYGDADGDAISEETPWAATSRKGRLRADLDRRYLEAHRRGDVGVAIGRSADFFGPGVVNSSLGGAFFPGALSGRPVLGIGDITVPHSYTYILDVARGLASLGSAPIGDGQVWHLPTQPAVPTTVVHQMVEEITGLPLTVDRLDAPAPYGPFDEQFMDEYRELFYQHQIPQNMISSRFERTFGVLPTPWRQALGETVEWYEHALTGGRLG